MKKSERVFYTKIFKNNKMVSTHYTHNNLRFLSQLRLATFTDLTKIWIRVTYGKRKDVFGKTVLFDNEGTYDNFRDLWYAARAFME